MFESDGVGNASFSEGPGCFSRGIDPEDLHWPRCGGVAEAMRYIGRNESGVVDLDGALLVIDIEDGFTLEQHDAFLAVVTVEGNRDAGIEGSDASDEAVTIEPKLAVEQSIAAATWLREQGARQYYFKYCSTFDSTDEGNIGPVTDALMDFLGADFTIACPAFPDNQRTLFKGYLFVGDRLLSESGMRHHPLTPMTDANLVRVLQRQIGQTVGLIDYTTVAKGEEAIRACIEELKRNRVRIAIVDAISNVDLVTMGRAFFDLKLVTAGSGVALGLPENFGIAANAEAARLPTASGKSAIVSGSCSVASNAQVVDFIRHGHPALPIDPLEVACGANVIDKALNWAVPYLNEGPVLIYATAEPDRVKAVQARLGVKEAGEMIEHTLSQIAAGLVRLGVRQLVVAGGETSGACVQALGITQMQIGPQIDPGVPWCYARSPIVGNGGLHIALKSGNFGTTDFFIKAFKHLS